MKLNSSKSWQFDWMKLESIAGKLVRGLITSGALLMIMEVLKNTWLPSLADMNPSLVAIIGILISTAIESIKKLATDYSQPIVVEKPVTVKKTKSTKKK